jgi:hypothetical protein
MMDVSYVSSMIGRMVVSRGTVIHCSVITLKGINSDLLLPHEGSSGEGPNKAAATGRKPPAVVAAMLEQR